jgi:2-polyprenyl-3-methyl-5-hydroxy-6-metoxy-1,4-benzoquinol methylase
MAFDKAYYDRYYRDPRTAVTSRAEMAQRARLIAAAADYVGLPVRQVLDAGCGMGLMRRPLLKALACKPRAQYTGLEASDYLCRRFGWQHGQLQSWHAPQRQRFDLVICYDVLQYLEREAARAAIANLGKLCRGLLYCSALTREDWASNCDQRRTDKVPGLRSASWYRRELRRNFESLGCSLWLHRDAPLVTWEMDRAA